MVCSPVCLFFLFLPHIYQARLPPWLSSKESTCNAGATGDMGSIPGLGRSPGGGNGNLLKYFCFENPVDRGNQWATVHGTAISSLISLTPVPAPKACRCTQHSAISLFCPVFPPGSPVWAAGRAGPGRGEGILQCCGLTCSLCPHC